MLHHDLRPVPADPDAASAASVRPARRRRVRRVDEHDVERLPPVTRAPGARGGRRRPARRAAARDAASAARFCTQRAHRRRVALDEHDARRAPRQRLDSDRTRAGVEVQHPRARDGRPSTSKSVTRTRSAVGRVRMPLGARRRRPRSWPPMIRTWRLPDRRQLEALAPASEERLAQRLVLREAEPRIARHEPAGVLPRLLEQPGVGEEAGRPELGEPGLARPEELAGAADARDRPRRGGSRPASRPSLRAAGAPSSDWARSPGGCRRTGPRRDPTRPRSWCSCARPNRSACSMSITEAFGTSIPTSITVVATRRSSRAVAERAHHRVLLVGRQAARARARRGSRGRGRALEPLGHLGRAPGDRSPPSPRPAGRRRRPGVPPASSLAKSTIRLVALAPAPDSVRPASGPAAARRGPRRRGRRRASARACAGSASRSSRARAGCSPLPRSAARCSDAEPVLLVDDGQAEPLEVDRRPGSARACRRRCAASPVGEASERAPGAPARAAPAGEPRDARAPSGSASSRASVR